MSNEPIVLTGVVYGYGNQPNAVRPARGDCKIEPKNNNVNFVTASVFDGAGWRKFFIPNAPSIGETVLAQEMAKAKAMIERWKGRTVTWGKPTSDARNNAYHFAGIRYC
ncbi:hypothetical protein [Chromobacterium haemolyticum]|uniref:hypothetical protein n=1 Tax=Chromobacterium TaxID=535 RepID=UPI00193BF2A7|nr:hypothetical protein JOS77_13295 [Chromobacterium haemolyticum]